MHITSQIALYPKATMDIFD